MGWREAFKRNAGGGAAAGTPIIELNGGTEGETPPGQPAKPALSAVEGLPALPEASPVSRYWLNHLIRCTTLSRW